MNHHQTVNKGLSGSLSAFQVFTLAFGAMIGVAWIPLLGEWLSKAGSIGAMLAFMGGGLCIGVIATSYLYLARKLPITGGEIAFAYHVLGPFWGFATGWMLIYTYCAVCAYLAISVSWITGALLPALRGAPIYHLFGEAINANSVLLCLALTAILTFLHIRGAQLAATAQSLLTMLMIASCIIFIGAGLMAGDTQNIQPALAHNTSAGPWLGIAAVFAATPLFYGGFNLAIQAIGERAPGVTMGKIAMALISAVICGAMFYILIILSASMAAPRGVILENEFPAAAAFEAALNNPAFANLVLFAGLLGLLTTWNSVIFACSRMIYALAQEGFLPPAFAKPHPKYETPHLAVIAIAILTFIGVLAGTGALGPIIGSAAATISIAFLIVSISAIALANRYKDKKGRPLRNASFLISLLFVLIAMGEPLSGASDFTAPPAWIALGAWFGMGAVFWLCIGQQSNSKQAEASS